jgi:hypothetical protein
MRDIWRGLAVTVADFRESRSLRFTFFIALLGVLLAFLALSGARIG